MLPAEPMTAKRDQKKHHGCPAMELLHTGLIRTTTCANGNVCDYWIVGDKSPYLKKYPKKIDEQGYFYNEVPDRSPHN